MFYFIKIIIFFFKFSPSRYSSINCTKRFDINKEITVSFTCTQYQTKILTIKLS